MSNKVEVNESNFQQLQGKVVVITGMSALSILTLKTDQQLGGANGIGAATVRILVQAGAHVVVGDFDQAAGQKLAETFNDAPTKPTFVQMDVAKYEDNVRLFRTALETHGRVDHALACAGILERGKWFDPALTVETIDKPETTKVIDVNFVASAHFARIAMVFLKHDRRQGEDKSIVLISSAAGFRDSPGLFMYQVSTQKGDEIHSPAKQCLGVETCTSGSFACHSQNPLRARSGRAEPSEIYLAPVFG